MTFNAITSITNQANTWTALQTFANNISFGGKQLSVSSLATNDVLTYNGTNWVNQQPSVGVSSVASYSQTGLAALVNNAINYTPPATANKRYRISTMVNIKTLGAGDISVTVGFTDASGTAQSINIIQTLQSGNGTVRNDAQGAGIWTASMNFSIDNSATAITVSTTGTTATSYAFAASLEAL